MMMRHIVIMMPSVMNNIALGIELYSAVPICACIAFRNITNRFSSADREW